MSSFIELVELDKSIGMERNSLIEFAASRQRIQREVRATHRQIEDNRLQAEKQRLLLAKEAAVTEKDKLLVASQAEEWRLQATKETTKSKSAG